MNTIGFKELGAPVVKDILETLYRCLEDYQLDRRGDVGSWVREEAMLALTQFLRMLIQGEGMEEVSKELDTESASFYERFI